MRYLVKMGITLNKSPVKDATKKYCPREFSTYGSCCQYSSLASVAQKQSTKLINSWKSFYLRVGVFETKIIPFLKKISKDLNFTKLQPEVTRLKADSKAAAEFQKILSILPKDEKELDYVKAIITSLDSFKNFLKEHRSCLNALREVRANTLRLNVFLLTNSVLKSLRTK